MMRIFVTVCLLIISIVLPCVPHAAFAQTLKAGIAEWPPYQMYDGGDVTGVVIDLLQEVSARTGYTIAYQQIPQKRMLRYFRATIITLEPACNPAWRETDTEISRYTVPYIPANNVVIMKKGREIKAMSPSDFRWNVLGCNLGYAYTDGFEEEFRNGTIIREDVTNGTRGNLQKLAANRVDGIIADPLVAHYWINELQMDQDNFEEVYTLKADNSLSMRLHVSQESLLPTLNKTLEAMKAEGFIEKTVEKYTKE